MIAALGLAFLSGYVALSYEILWYRALSFMSGGDARTFALLLGAYLVGLAGGSLIARRACRGSGDAERARQLGSLFRLALLANLFGFFVVPGAAWLATQGLSWMAALPLVALAAGGLGTVFPLVAHCWIAPDERVGLRVSCVYLANILGSTAGSLLTGFVILDHASLATAHVLLGILGLATAASPLIPVRGRVRATGLIAVGTLGALCAGLGTRPFERVYEKLQLKSEYGPTRRFKHVVETRSGVITVNEDDQIFGGGAYDGAFNTGLRADRNSVFRCYAATELRADTKNVLMIGLSSGSWATILSNLPTLERLTIVEINPGYLELLPKYPEVAGLLSHPKVRIDIDDGRRWLVRNREDRFDAIYANATFHWRANATNLLSREFLELIRSRLKEGGYYFYNTTESLRILKTGCSVFPHALRIGSFLAVSDAPLALDLPRLREKLFDYPRAGRTVFDRNDPADRRALDRVLQVLETSLETRGHLLDRCSSDLRIATDDNMGTEFSDAR
jgi:predicted membrane-bound spermidine synthase